MNIGSLIEYTACILKDGIYDPFAVQRSQTAQEYSSDSYGIGLLSE